MTPTKKDRADSGNRALMAYQMITGIGRDEAFAELLCDLMCLTETERLSFRKRLARAVSIYEA